MNKGFTLIELLVAISLSSIIIVALVRIMGTSLPLYRSAFIQTTANETARVQLRRIAHEIRSAVPSDTGGFPLVDAAASRLIFYANIDSDSAVERVRYELVGTNVVRGITKPSGNPLTYNTDQEVTTIIARSVQNGGNPVFMYYGTNYPSDMNSVPEGNLAAITYIAFSLTLDADTTLPPPAVTVQSQVQLRNLKTNL